MAGGNFESFSLLDIYQLEVSTQTTALSDSLLALERNPTDAQLLEALMRASHSLKGAARLVGVRIGERLAHAMEDLLVKAQHGEVLLGAAHIDVLLQSTDLLRETGTLTDATLESWSAGQESRVDALIANLHNPPARAVEPERKPGPPPAATPELAPAATPELAPAAAAPVKDKTLRLATEKLDSLLGLSGELVVSAAWMTEFSTSLLRLKALHGETTRALARVRESDTAERRAAELAACESLATRTAGLLSERLLRLDNYDRQMSALSRRLHQEVVAIRMRPIADVVPAIRRTVRDAARSLGKVVDLDIVGSDTLVDRDILDRLEGSMTHLLRNAVDHGIELPVERR
ncbi:MAG TPA: Hpt domain-containing protein, partial [Candidatus Xenobia bacterium]